MRQSASFSKLVWPFSDVQRRQCSDLVGGEQGEMRTPLCQREAGSPGYEDGSPGWRIFYIQKGT